MSSKFKMIAFGGWAAPRLVSFRGLIQNFRRASPPLSYGSPPPPPTGIARKLLAYFAWPFIYTYYLQALFI